MISKIKHEADQVKAKEMRWFWVGLLLSIPVSYYIGVDKDTERLVIRLTILSVFLLIAVANIFRKINRLKIEDTLFKNSTFVKYILAIGLLLVGHAIGYATVKFLAYIFNQ